MACSPKPKPAEPHGKRALIEEFGLSEEIVQALPPDIPSGVAPPGL